MQGEFNEFNYNNTNISFSVSTNNIALSDELTADSVYQNKMGTNYSKAKNISRAINLIGLSLILGAGAVGAGSILRNAFIVNPPTVSNASIKIEGTTLTYNFEIVNKINYKTTFFINLNNKEIYSFDCTEPKIYSGTFDELEKGQKGYVSIRFTNSFDYIKEIYTQSFTVGG